MVIMNIPSSYGHHPGTNREAMQMRQSGRWPPREYGPGERVPINWRVSPAVKEFLDGQAEASGRSLSAQLTMICQRAADADRDTFGALTFAFGKVNAGLVLLLGQIMTDATSTFSGETWDVDPEHDAVVAAALAETIAILTGIEVSVMRPAAISEGNWRTRINFYLKPMAQLRDYLIGARPARARLLDELIIERMSDAQRQRLCDWTPPFKLKPPTD
jgi:hypothetical protein